MEADGSGQQRAERAGSRRKRTEVDENRLEADWKWPNFCMKRTMFLVHETAVSELSQYEGRDPESFGPGPPI